MLYFPRILFIILFTLNIYTSHAFAASEESAYRIGNGDVLSVSVWKDESLTRQVIVLPDGTISFPLVGQITAKGKTILELEQMIRDHLSKYVPEPILTIEVIRVNSLMIYVIGKVNRPGRFELMDNINILQALSLAGGLNPYAKSNQIKVFRETDESTEIIEFDYGEVSKGKKLEQNIILERGDVVVVP